MPRQPNGDTQEAQATRIHHTPGDEPNYVEDVAATPTAPVQDLPAHDPYTYGHIEQPGLQVTPNQDKEVVVEEFHIFGPSKKQRWFRRRVCGVPIWMLLLAGVILIIGAMMGGILTGLKTKEIDKQSCYTVATHQTICRNGGRPQTSLGEGTSQPINDTWYYIANQMEKPNNMILSVSPPGNILNATKLSINQT